MTSNEATTEFIMSLNDRLKPKVAKPKCKLVGTDGNVFALAGRVEKCLTRAKMPERATEFSERLEGCDDYAAALRLMMEYVEVY